MEAVWETPQKKLQDTNVESSIRLIVTTLCSDYLLLVFNGHRHFFGAPNRSNTLLHTDRLMHARACVHTHNTQHTYTHRVLVHVNLDIIVPKYQFIQQDHSIPLTPMQMSNLCLTADSYHQVWVTWGRQKSEQYMNLPLTDFVNLNKTWLPCIKYLAIQLIQDFSKHSPFSIPTNDTPTQVTTWHYCKKMEHLNWDPYFPFSVCSSH